MSIIIERTGLFDTLQDPGRPGFRSFGVPTGGWFDDVQARLANALAGNENDSPCLEITQFSGLMRLQEELYLAVAGPGAVIQIDQENSQRHVYQNSVATWLKPGSAFEIQHRSYGMRSYLAVAGGGWQGEPVLGSVSDESRLLTDHKLIPIRRITNSSCDRSIRRIANELIQSPTIPAILTFIPSSEFQKVLVDQPRIARLLTGWRASPRSNRVGVRFEHPASADLAKLWPIEAGRLSQPVMPGTIQWTGSELIILGVAGGTMGGYPTLGQVAAADLAKLAQIRSDQEVQLLSITPEQARHAFVKHEENLAQILNRIRFTAKHQS